MENIEEQLENNNPWKLDGQEGFVYVGTDDYNIKGNNNYLFACVVEAGMCAGKFLPCDLRIFPIKEDQLSIEGDNITTKDGKFPFHRMTFLDSRFNDFSTKIRRYQEK